MCLRDVFIDTSFCVNGFILQWWERVRVDIPSMLSSVIANAVSFYFINEQFEANVAQ
jgi:hypothetical protein